MHFISHSWTYPTYDRNIQQISKYRNPSDETNNHWKKAPTHKMDNKMIINIKIIILLSHLIHNIPILSDIATFWICDCYNPVQIPK